MAAPPPPPPRPRFRIGGDPLALEAELARDFEQSADGGPFARTFVVAPTVRLLDRLSHRLTEARGALAGVHFLHHRGLAAQVLAQAGRAEPADVGAPLLELLLLERVRTLDLALARYVARQPAAAGALLASLRDLRDAGVTAAAAQRAPLTPRGRELIAILAAFESLLDELRNEGGDDGAGHANAAARVAASGPPPCARLFHYGAYELIGSHRELLTALARRVPTTFSVVASASSGPPEQLARAFDAPLEALPATPSRRQNHLVSAAGPREEMRLALRTLLGWHVNDGVPFDAMAILARSPGSHLRALRAEAALLDLAPDTSFATPLALAPLAQSLRLLLEPSDGFARADHDAAGRDADRDVARAFRRADPPAQRVAALAQWARARDGEVLAQALDEVARELARHAASRRALAEPGLLARHVMRCLEAAPLDGGRPHAAVGALRVLDFHQARALPFARAVLVGANDRLLPRRAGEDFFLGDADRRALAETTGAPVPLRQSLRADEELLFDTVCGAVSDQLVVTFARADGEDRDAAPSLFLRRLSLDPERPERLIPRAPREESRALLERTGLLTPQEALTQAAARAPARGGELRALALAHGFDAALLDAGLARIEAIDDADGKELRFDAAAVSVRPRPHFNPTALGQLGRCPLQYFFAEELGVAAPDELEDGELSPKLLGSLLHRTLESLYRAILVAGQPVKAAPLLAAARAAVPVHFERAAAELPRASLPPPRLWAIRRAQLVRDLTDFVVADLHHMEQLGLRAGEFEAARKVELKVAGTPLALSYRIDRILLDSEGGEWIGDYKLTRLAALAQQIRPLHAVRATALQLPLYRLARAAEGHHVAGLEFLSLRRPRPRDGEPFLAVDLGLLEKNDAAVADSLAALLELRERGSFPLVSDPGDHLSQCSRCDFRRACRHSHAPTVARVAAAAANERFYSLAEKALQKRDAG